MDWKKKNSYVFGADSGIGSSEEHISGSDVATSKAENISIFQSSIVDTVRTRDVYVKKTKASMFVTQPSSTSKCKKDKKQGNSIVDVDKVGKSPAKTSRDEYKGRANFRGHEEVYEEERKLLTDFSL